MRCQCLQPDKEHMQQAVKGRSAIGSALFAYHGRRRCAPPASRSFAPVVDDMYHQTLTAPSNGYDGMVDADLTAFRPVGVRFRAEPSAFNPSHFSTSPLDSLIDLGSALRPDQQHVFRSYDFAMHPPRSDHTLFEDASMNGAAAHQQQRTYQAQETGSDFCAICGDASTGKHYGAYSCDGCKGFFRRTIRRAQTYTCRFTQSCLVDKDHRNSCRFCRFQKCIAAGMRRDAIQNERDAIGRRRNRAPSKPDDPNSLQPVASDAPVRKVSKPDEETRGKSPRPETTCTPRQPSNRPPNDFLELLMRSETMCKQLRCSVIQSTDQVKYATSQMEDKQVSPDGLQLPPGTKMATLDDVGKSIHQQLVLMVEWAKTLPPFNELPIEDQIALLKNYAAQLMIIAVAYRSVHLENAIYLANDSVLPKEHSPTIGDVNMVVTRIIDELVVPMKYMEIEEAEYVALKAVVFFNPIAKGIKLEAAVGPILRTRRSILASLEYYVVNSEKYLTNNCRFAMLLLLLPPLQAIAQQLVEDVQLARMFGLANVDSLMQELMLQDDKPSALHHLNAKNSPFGSKGVSPGGPSPFRSSSPSPSDSESGATSPIEIPTQVTHL